jgi:hypothetical protein
MSPAEKKTHHNDHERRDVRGGTSSKKIKKCPGPHSQAMTNLRVIENVFRVSPCPSLEADSAKSAG